MSLFSLIRCAMVFAGYLIHNQKLVLYENVWSSFKYHEDHVFFCVYKDVYELPGGKAETIILQLGITMFKDGRIDVCPELTLEVDGPTLYQLPSHQYTFVSGNGTAEDQFPPSVIVLEESAFDYEPLLADLHRAQTAIEEIELAREAGAAS